MRPCPSVVSAAAVAAPKTMTRPHAAPYREATIDAVANTAAYIVHLRASTTDAPGSREIEAHRGPASPNGSRQRSQTSALAGATARSQPTGRGTAWISVYAARRPRRIVG